MANVLVIGVDHSITEEDLDFAAMQKAVGGYIEAVPARPEGTLLVNEEGRLMRLPINSAATRLAGQFIVGPAILTGPDDGSGEFTDVTDDQKVWLKVALYAEEIGEGEQDA